MPMKPRCGDNEYVQIVMSKVLPMGRANESERPNRNEALNGAKGGYNDNRAS